VKRLTCYQIYDKAPRLVPARSDRPWMDATDQRYAYRCLPLSIANAMGWELLSPARVVAEWNGGNGLPDISVTVDDDRWSESRLAGSHFGHGILTFQTGYLFRTDPGVAVWARGVPNWPKDGIAPLDGIIETDWLTFTFTMNWQFTRPGRIVFEKDEPFCFITLIEYRALEKVAPEIARIEDDPVLHKDFAAWRDARLEFNRKLTEHDPETAKQGWQRFYLRGEGPSGVRAPETHISKVKIAAPKTRTTAKAVAPAPDADRSDSLPEK
jgi:hypothetical protein